jgi:hypothetical protein
MSSITDRFITNLKSFNRKERFFLVGWALGNREFSLGPTLRRELSSVLGLDIPADAFAAMDYHFDWIYASAFLSTADGAGGIYPNSAGLVSGNQEDIDLIVAFDDGGMGRLIMIEAKGVTGWTNKQTTSKARRLEAIFGQRGDKWPDIRPYFVLTSPRETEGLDSRSWPGWMKRDDGHPYWMRMEIPAGLRRVTRCDERGRITAEGGHWRVLASH